MSSKQTPIYIVLGATGGIGSALSRRLRDRGATVVLGARGAEPLQALAAEIGGVACPVDATDAEAVHALVAQTQETHGRLSGIANCVGSILLKPAHLTSADEFAETLAKNLNTAFYTVRSAARSMLKTGGSIVLCSSAVGRLGLANHEAIAAAKAGVAGLTRSAAATYGPRGIRVNCVAPGLVETPMTRRITTGDAGRKASEAMHVLGRLGQPHDVAGAIDWLLDDARSGWVTGQVLGVDGGLGSARGR